MEFFSTGIEAVDRIGHINISGDVKPRIWHKTIVNEQGKPQRLAMDILSEIVYWYRPQEVRDENCLFFGFLSVRISITISGIRFPFVPYSLILAACSLLILMPV